MFVCNKCPHRVVFWTFCLCLLAWSGPLTCQPHTSIRQCTHLVLLFIFQGRGKPRLRRKPRWVRKWLSEKRRERYGHYSPLLNELKTEDEKAFFNYTRLPRGLYDEVLRRVEGRIEKKDKWYRKSLPPGLKLSITLRHLACGDNYWGASKFGVIN